MDATFASLNISNILQMLSLERKSVYISIINGTGRGYVVMQAGEIFDAQYQELRGEEAMLYLLNHNEGKLSTEPGPTNITRTINVPLEGLLMKAAQLADERAAITTNAIDVDLANIKLNAIQGYLGSLITTLEGEIVQTYPQDSQFTFFNSEQFSSKVRTSIMNWKSLLDLDNSNLFQLYGDQLSIFILHLREGHFFIVAIESPLASSKVGREVQSALGL